MLMQADHQMAAIFPHSTRVFPLTVVIVAVIYSSGKI